MITWQCIPNSDGTVTLHAVRGTASWFVHALTKPEQVRKAIERVTDCLAEIDA